jgi:putative hemolysin
MIIRTALAPALLLFGGSILMAVKTALQDLSSSEIDEEFNNGRIRFFLLKKIKKKCSLSEFLTISSLIAYIGYAITTTLFLQSQSPLHFAILFLLLLGSHLIFNFIAVQAKFATLKLFSFLASLYLTPLFPIIYPILWLEANLAPKPDKGDLLSSSEQLKKRLSKLLQEAEIHNLLDPTEKKLVSSIAQFSDLVVREIMVPRPDMLCLQTTTTVYSSLKMFIQEGYSRIPLYTGSIDDISAVLLYKDVMKFCVDALDKNELELIKKTPVGELAGEILYSPENKKIRDLFQEMRTKKIHSAIVVNEYGCTEGLVTIEDILEELVGSEIQDEHDASEEILYKEAPDKSWIVDATMSIIDVEKELGIGLPHGPEYETIAGYISLQARCIPKPGTIVHGENFHIEVLKSDERQIYEVKITPENKNVVDSF